MFLLDTSQSQKKSKERFEGENDNSLFTFIKSKVKIHSIQCRYSTKLRTTSFYGAHSVVAGLSCMIGRLELKNQ